MFNEEAIAECSQCRSLEASPSLQDCFICDRLIEGCADCYGAHINSHSQDEIDTAFFNFYSPEVENSLPYSPIQWYELN
jgi:hypothetical protein